MEMLSAGHLDRAGQSNTLGLALELNEIGSAIIVQRASAKRKKVQPVTSFLSQIAAFDTLANAIAHGDRPALFRATDQALQKLVGHRLFTLLVVLPDGEHVQRFWSTDADAFPLSGRKRMGNTPWGDLVLRRMQPFLGPDMDSIRWAFSDHELIAGLGLGSAINIPIIAQKRLLGAIALLDVEHHYDAAKLEIAMRVAPYLVDAFRQEIDLGLQA